VAEGFLRGWFAQRGAPADFPVRVEVVRAQQAAG
jgi:hypothetical protein